MKKINLEMGFYAQVWCRFTCSSTGNQWEGKRELYMFNSNVERDKFVKDYIGRNYDAETLPKFYEFEIIEFEK